MPALPRRFRRHEAEAVAGVGTVVLLINTHEGDEARPMVQFVVRVDADEPYDACASAAVPTEALHLLRPGARVGLRIDPAQPASPQIDLSHVSITPATHSR